MTPILIAIIVAFVICAAFYALVVVKERTIHLEAERDAEIRHAADWKGLATNLTQRGLLFRELPLLNEDVEAMTSPPRETEQEDREETLEDLERQMRGYDEDINVATEGELGERRLLAQKIALRRRDRDLKTKSELATEDSMNIFTPEDMQHLRAQ